ncbi:MAG: FkbM family methyltransferase [Minisyncoccota bacterium]
MQKSFIQRVWPFIKARFAPRGARISFSQYGEDLIIKDILKKEEVKEITYIDIGTHHPYFGNNTYLLYKSGGRGVLVEPNSSMCEVIKHKRPKDVCLNAGVGGRDGEADFYEFKQSTRNTFSKTDAETQERRVGEKAKTKKRKIISLNTVVDKYFEDKNISLVSIDAEGLDFDIISNFNFSKRPKVFCVESNNEDKRVENLMVEHGYTCVAKIFQNAIFVDKK